MVVSSVSIASNALILLGDTAISSFTDGSAGADVASALYESTYQALLTDTRWRFATKKVQLSRYADKPLNTWEYKYQLPSDCLYVQVSSADDFDIIDGDLYTNEATVSIDYTYRVDESKLPAYFVKMVEFALAAQFAIPITGNATRAEEYRVMFEAQAKRARFADASQRPPVQIEDSPYTSARSGG